MRFAHLHECPHLNSIIFHHFWLVTEHTSLESRRDLTAVIQVTTIVPGGSVRELIKVNKTIARFPQVIKSFLFSTLCKAQKTNWHFFCVAENSSFNKYLLNAHCVP